MTAGDRHEFPGPVAEVLNLSSEALSVLGQIDRTSRIVSQLVDRLEQEPFTDKRLASIARTQLQLGFMSMRRAAINSGAF